MDCTEKVRSPSRAGTMGLTKLQDFSIATCALSERTGEPILCGCRRRSEIPTMRVSKQSESIVSATNCTAAGTQLSVDTAGRTGSLDHLSGAEPVREKLYTKRPAKYVRLQHTVDRETATLASRKTY